MRRLTHQALLSSGRLRSGAVYGHRSLQPQRQEVDGELVGGHHDGSVRDLSNQLDDQAAVEAPAAFGAIDGPQAGPEAAVARPILPKTGPGNF